MIAELFPDAYDVEGQPTFRPDKLRRKRFPSTFPIGRFVSQPLSVQCLSLEDLRRFLRTCRAISDKEQFGREDYWMPPEEFETTRKGDCEDFSMYAWRQLLQMGYKARFVAGTVHDGLAGHAWVTFEDREKHFLLEPQACFLGLRFPQLDTLQYKPRFSVEWDGERPHFFRHKERQFSPPIALLPPLVFEWIWYRLRMCVLTAYWIARLIAKKIWKASRVDGAAHRT